MLVARNSSNLANLLSETRILISLFFERDNAFKFADYMRLINARTFLFEITSKYMYILEKRYACFLDFIYELH